MRLYIGTALKAVDNWQTIHPPIIAPGNYKKPESIAKYVEEETAKLHAGGAAEKTLTGEIDHAVVLQVGSASTEKEKHYVREGVSDSGEIANDGDPQVIYQGSGGMELLTFIMERTGLLLDAKKRDSLVLVGCKLKKSMRLAALDWMTRRSDTMLPFSMAWAVEMHTGGEFTYNGVPGYIDPLSVLFGSSRTDVGAAARRLGQPEPDEPDAMSMAHFAYWLSRNFLGI